MQAHTGHICMSALKPAGSHFVLVIRVRPTLKTNPDWIVCDAKLRNTLYGGATMLTYILHEPRPTVCYHALGSTSAWKPHPCFVCVCMHIYRLA